MSSLLSYNFTSKDICRRNRFLWIYLQPLLLFSRGYFLLIILLNWISFHTKQQQKKSKEICAISFLSSVVAHNFKYLGVVCRLHIGNSAHYRIKIFFLFPCLRQNTQYSLKPQGGKEPKWWAACVKEIIKV